VFCGGGGGGADKFVANTSIRYHSIYTAFVWNFFFLYDEYLIAYKECATRSRAGFSQCVVTRPRFGRARNRGSFSGTPALGPIQPFIEWVPEGPCAPWDLLGPYLRRFLVTSAGVSRSSSSRRLCY